MMKTSGAAVVGLATAGIVAAEAAETREEDAVQVLDLLVVGGGPGGLSAALVAARAGRKVTMIDGGTPRNERAPALHTFVSRDGILPADFRRISREQLSLYPNFSFLSGWIASLSQTETGWLATLADGQEVRTSKVLLALGLVDELPAVPGVKENWGRGVHHCVFCDGHEHRGGSWGILLDDPIAVPHLVMFRGWAGELTIFTNASDTLDEAVYEEMRVGGFQVERRKIREIYGKGDGHALKGMEMEDGERVEIDSLWVRPKQSQTKLVKDLGLILREDGAVATDEKGESNRPGIYVAGDMTAGPAQQAILAAADGARVTYGICAELIKQAGK